jgi:hypothetical protein
VSVAPPTGMLSKPLPPPVQKSVLDTADHLAGVSYGMSHISKSILIDVHANGQEYTAAYAKAIGVPDAVENAASVFATAPASIAAIKPYLTPEFAQQFGDGGEAMLSQAAAGVRELAAETDPRIVASRADGFALGAQRMSEQLEALAGVRNY